eukprot:174844-Chlamydomonas_euryale.AAC.5
MHTQLCKCHFTTGPPLRHSLVSCDIARGICMLCHVDELVIHTVWVVRHNLGFQGLMGKCEGVLAICDF